MCRECWKRKKENSVPAGKDAETEKELERACAEAEHNCELTVKVAQEVEEALHGIHDLEEDAISALDNLDDQKLSQRVEATQTPRTQLPT